MRQLGYGLARSRCSAVNTDPQKIGLSVTAGLSFINDVEDALANGTVDRRGELLRRVTDLFVVGSDQYTYDQIELFDQVFIRLAAQIEISARALLAIRLAPLPNAPPHAR